MNNKNLILGVLIILLGGLVGLYLNIYCLIMGIYDIIANHDVMKGILLIFLREFIGAVLFFVCFAIGIARITKG